MIENTRYTAGSPLNGLGDKYLPITSVGVIVSPAHGYPRYSWNGYNQLINPYATEAERANGACVDVNEFFARHLEEIIEWQETGTNCSALIDCERVYGGRGDDKAQVVSFDEEEHARRAGRGWLVDQWLNRGYELAQQGRQVIFHNGCPDSARLAKKAIDTDNPAIIGDFLRRAFESYNRCIELGIIPGFDGCTGEPHDSLSYAFALLFSNARRAIQLESMSSTKFPHWKGFRTRIVYPTFKKNHMHGKEDTDWLDLNHPSFLEWYPDFRVSFFAGHFMKSGDKWESEATKRSVISRIMIESKKIIRAGGRILLQLEIAKACLPKNLNIPATSFLP